MLTNENQRVDFLELFEMYATSQPRTVISTGESSISPKVQRVYPIEDLLMLTDSNQPLNDNKKLLCYSIGIHQELSASVGRIRVR